MKRFVLFVAAALHMLTAATVFAAPVNDLGRGQTALGLGSDTFYLEHKLSDSFTLGIQNVDRYGDMTDLYGQFDLSGNMKAIVGSRDLNHGSKVYAGAAVHGDLSPDMRGYASLVGGGGFSELQVGGNIRLASNLDLNVDYHSFNPDYGRSKSGVGAGLTLKF